MAFPNLDVKEAIQHLTGGKFNFDKKDSRIEGYIERKLGGDIDFKDAKDFASKNSNYETLLKTSVGKADDLLKQYPGNKGNAKEVAAYMKAVAQEVADKVSKTMDKADDDKTNKKELRQKLEGDIIQTWIDRRKGQANPGQTTETPLNADQTAAVGIMKKVLAGKYTFDEAELTKHATAIVRSLKTLDEKSVKEALTKDLGAYRTLNTFNKDIEDMTKAFLAHKTGNGLITQSIGDQVKAIACDMQVDLSKMTTEQAFAIARRAEKNLVDEINETQGTVKVDELRKSIATEVAGLNPDLKLNADQLKGYLDETGAIADKLSKVPANPQEAAAYKEKTATEIVQSIYGDKLTADAKKAKVGDLVAKFGQPSAEEQANALVQEKIQVASRPQETPAQAAERIYAAIAKDQKDPDVAAKLALEAVAKEFKDVNLSVQDKAAMVKAIGDRAYAAIIPGDVDQAGLLEGKKGAFADYAAKYFQTLAIVDKPEQERASAGAKYVYGENVDMNSQEAKVLGAYLKDPNHTRESKAAYLISKREEVERAKEEARKQEEQKRLENDPDVQSKDKFLAYLRGKIIGQIRNKKDSGWDKLTPLQREIYEETLDKMHAMHLLDHEGKGTKGVKHYLDADNGKLREIGKELKYDKATLAAYKKECEELLAKLGEAKGGSTGGGQPAVPGQQGGGTQPSGGGAQQQPDYGNLLIDFLRTARTTDQALSKAIDSAIADGIKPAITRSADGTFKVSFKGSKTNNQDVMIENKDFNQLQTEIVAKLKQYYGN